MLSSHAIARFSLDMSQTQSQSKNNRKALSYIILITV
ncbi:hypothetical protein MHK_009132 [Candidatus Magnetomorum sp. HK-1]|nr:hypothetical protein MHK_009132 [Candidatus Magnetomorum sp. HK-1]